MPFSNPIVAGETLVLPGVQSDGYVSSVSGWRVQKDGNAEFNAASFRGTVTVVGSGSNRIRLIAQSGIPTIEFRNADGELFYIDVDNDSLRFQPSTAGSASFFITREEGGKDGIVLRSSALGAPSVLFDDDDGFLKYGSYSPWTEDGWQAVTVNSGGGFASNGPEVKLLPDGTCIMRGGITGHSTVAGTSIATLPVGYRPARSGRWVCATEATADNNHVGITTAGVISIAKAAVNNSWFTQIVFSTI